MNDLGILGDVSEVFIVAEATVTKEVVDLIRREVLQTVGPVRGIARTYIRGRHISVVAEEEERVTVDSSTLELGTVARRGGVVFIVDDLLITVNGGVEE